MIKDTTGIIQAGASATPANNFVLDASAANGTAKLYSGNAGTPVNTVLTIDAAGGLTPLAPMHLAAVTPIFSAYQSVGQTLASNTWTKLNFQTKEFDTTNAFDNVTNMRFTPLVAGYYQVIGEMQLSATPCNQQLQIYKNGVTFKSGNNPSTASACGVSALIYCNGTTDYLECVGYLTTGQALAPYETHTYFQAALIARV